MQHKVVDKAEYYRRLPPNSFAPKEGHQPLDVAVVGAGIAGLMAAIALSQSGHNVEVSLMNLRTFRTRSIFTIPDYRFLKDPSLPTRLAPQSTCVPTPLVSLNTMNLTLNVVWLRIVKK